MKALTIKLNYKFQKKKDIIITYFARQIKHTDLFHAFYSICQHLRVHFIFLAIFEDKLQSGGFRREHKETFFILDVDVF